VRPLLHILHHSVVVVSEYPLAINTINRDRDDFMTVAVSGSCPPDLVNFEFDLPPLCLSIESPQKP
jgi:hypothetical protein